MQLFLVVAPVAIVTAYIIGRAKRTNVEDGIVTQLAISPDGTVGAAGVIGGTRSEAIIWNLQTGEVVTVLHGHRTARFLESTSVAFSPDGRRLATAALDKPAMIWDTSTWRRVLTVKDSGALGRTTFSPDGKVCATGSSLWDAATGHPLPPLKDADGRTLHPLSPVWFAPDGSFVAGAVSGAVLLWKIHPVSLYATLTGHSFSLDSLAISPDSSLAISPNSSTVAIATDDGRIVIWDVGRKAAQLSFTTEGWVDRLVFSPDGSKLAVAGASGVSLWDPTRGQPLVTLAKLEWNQGFLGFSPDGNRLVTGGPEGYSLCDPTTGKPLMTLAYSTFNRATVLSSDGSKLYVSSEGKTVQCWDLTTGQLSTITLVRHRLISLPHVLLALLLWLILLVVTSFLRWRRSRDRRPIGAASSDR